MKQLQHQFGNILVKTGADPNQLRRRIEALRAEIATTLRKRAGLDHAIESRRKTLERLQAQLVMNECGEAHTNNE